MIDFFLFLNDIKKMFVSSIIKKIPTDLLYYTVNLNDEEWKNNSIVEIEKRVNWNDCLQECIKNDQFDYVKEILNMDISLQPNDIHCFYWTIEYNKLEMADYIWKKYHPFISYYTLSKSLKYSIFSFNINTIDFILKIIPVNLFYYHIESFLMTNIQEIQDNHYFKLLDLFFFHFPREKLTLTTYVFFYRYLNRSCWKYIYEKINNYETKSYLLQKPLREEWTDIIKWILNNYEIEFFKRILPLISGSDFLFHHSNIYLCFKKNPKLTQSFLLKHKDLFKKKLKQYYNFEKKYEDLLRLYHWI